jgi:hypothetical protein
MVAGRWLDERSTKAEAKSGADHHHQKEFRVLDKVCECPEATLIALARSKGQVLTENTLRMVREALELRGVKLATFVEDIRPHFRNNILNPSGFLISRARQFHQLSRPAVVRTVAEEPAPKSAKPLCAACKGQMLVMIDHQIQPCPCATPEFRQEWEKKEAARARWSQVRES